MLPWYQNEAFWKAFAPVIFSPEQWRNAVTEVDHAVALLDLKPEDQVLDLACGPGRHTLELARRGFQVTGVDRNNEYLKKARRVARHEKYACRFVTADMREFRRPGAFDAVLNLFTSIGYFDDPEDDRQVLRNVFDSLKPGGRLLIETMGREVIARIFQERDWQEKDGVLFLEERRPDDGWSRLHNRWIRVDAEGRHEFTFSLRLFSGPELRDLLLATGFQSVRLCGNLAGAPYDHQAQRLVAAAVK
ncbi:MAG: class I SAM-dependent methyltransferase [Candidatus Zixiibacteriota bacterium]|nr:MAG: class I SAM-dependent methyltransferase [candidate division Zixibacteria bacterium]